MDKAIIIKVVDDSRDDIKKMMMHFLLKSYMRQLAKKEGSLCL